MASDTTDLKCFMHIPKCGGSSFYAALTAAHPRDTVSAPTHDRTVFGSFDRFSEMGAPLADHVVTTSAGFDDLDVGRFKVLGGYLSLPTLRSLVGPEAVATVLREPGSRLLSLYTALRTEPGLQQRVSPYALVEPAEQPLHEFLGDTHAAAVTDNQIARFVLAGDPRLPVDGFMTRDDAEAVAADAIARLEEFGCVTILELGAEAWSHLELFLGVTLTAQDAPTPPGPRDGSVPFAPLTAEALALLDDRCAADALIYDHFLLQRCDDEETAQRISEMSLVHQLITFGDRGGRAAAHAQEQEATIAGLEIARAEAEARTAEFSSAADAVRTELGGAGDTLRTERDDARSQLADSEQRLANAEDRLATAGGAEARVADLEQQLLAAGDERVALRASHAELESKHAALEAERGSAAGQHEDLVADLERRSADLKRQLDEQAGREADVRAELTEVRSSATWQLTAPARAAGDRLGRFLRR